MELLRYQRSFVFLYCGLDALVCRKFTCKIFLYTRILVAWNLMLLNRFCQFIFRTLLPGWICYIFDMPLMWSISNSCTCSFVMNWLSKIHQRTMCAIWYEWMLAAVTEWWFCLSSSRIVLSIIPAPVNQLKGIVRLLNVLGWIRFTRWEKYLCMLSYQMQ